MDKVKRQGARQVAYFTDDGFALGVAYILAILKQGKQFESMHWFDTMYGKYGEEQNATKTELAAVKGKRGRADKDMISELEIKSGIKKSICCELDKISGTKAEANGKVTSNGGEPLTSYGFAYGKSSSPTIENNKLEVGTTDLSGEYKGLISGLETSTKYYVRAYATNARGTSYGVNKDFTTTNGLPGVSTVSSESVNGNSAVINGKIDDNGGSTLTSYGFAYAESPNPTIDGFKIAKIAQSGVKVSTTLPTRSTLLSS